MTDNPRRVLDWFVEALSDGYTIDVDGHDDISGTKHGSGRYIAPFTMEELKKAAKDAI